MTVTAITLAWIAANAGLVAWLWLRAELRDRHREMKRQAYRRAYWAAMLKMRRTA